MSQCSLCLRHVTCICHRCGRRQATAITRSTVYARPLITCKRVNVLRLTIAQRLWLGLGLILALFAVADLVSLRAANSVDVALQTLVSGGDERRGAGYNMRS